MICRQVYWPFCNSLSHTWVMVLECFLWWISHNDNVWILCCVLFSSLNFFTKLLSVNEDMFSCLFLRTTAVPKPEVNKMCQINCCRVYLLFLSHKHIWCHAISFLTYFIVLRRVVCLFTKENFFRYRRKTDYKDFFISCPPLKISMGQYGFISGLRFRGFMKDTS